MSLRMTGQPGLPWTGGTRGEPVGAAGTCFSRLMSRDSVFVKGILAYSLQLSMGQLERMSVEAVSQAPLRPEEQHPGILALRHLNQATGPGVVARGGMAVCGASV